MDDLLGIGIPLLSFIVMYGPAIYALKADHPNKWGLLGISLIFPIFGGLASLVVLIMSAPSVTQQVIDARGRSSSTDSVIDEARIKTESPGAPPTTFDDLRHYERQCATWILLGVTSAAFSAGMALDNWGESGFDAVYAYLLLPPLLLVALAAVLVSILGLISGPVRYRKRLAVWWGLMITGFLFSFSGLIPVGSTQALFIVVWFIPLAAIAIRWLIGIRLERLRSRAGTSLQP